MCQQIQNGSSFPLVNICFFQRTSILSVFQQTWRKCSSLAPVSLQNVRQKKALNTFSKICDFPLRKFLSCTFPNMEEFASGSTFLKRRRKESCVCWYRVSAAVRAPMHLPPWLNVWALGYLQHIKCKLGKKIAAQIRELSKKISGCESSQWMQTFNTANKWKLKIPTTLPA